MHYQDDSFNTQDWASHPPTFPFYNGSQVPIDWGCSLNGAPGGAGVTACRITVTASNGSTSTVGDTSDAVGVDFAQGDLPTACPGPNDCAFTLRVDARDAKGHSAHVIYTDHVSPPTTTPNAKAATQTITDHAASSFASLLQTGFNAYSLSFIVSDAHHNPVAYGLADGTVIPDAAGFGRIVAAGAGNYHVIDRAGNIVATGMGKIIAAGAGNIIAAGAGNIVAAGAGNIVAAGAGNIIGAGAGNFVNTGSRNFRVSAAARSLRSHGSDLVVLRGHVHRLNGAAAVFSNVASFGVGTFTATITAIPGRARDHRRNAKPVTLARGTVDFGRRGQVRTMVLLLTPAGRRLIATVTRRNLARRKHHRRAATLVLAVRDQFVPAAAGKPVTAMRTIVTRPGTRIRATHRH